MDAERAGGGGETKLTEEGRDVHYKEMKTRFAVILLVLNATALAAGYLYFSQVSTKRAEAAAQSAAAELAACRSIGYPRVPA